MYFAAIFDIKFRFTYFTKLKPRETETKGRKNQRILDISTCVQIATQVYITIDESRITVDDNEV